MEATSTAAAELTPTYGMGGRVVWSYIWRVLLISLLWGVLVFGALFGAAFALKNLSLIMLGGLIVNVLSALFGLVLSMVVLGIVFDKRYRRFTVRAVDTQTGEVWPRRWHVRLRLWWSMFWRGILIGIPVMAPLVVINHVQIPKMEAYQHYHQCKLLLDDYYARKDDPKMAALAADDVQRFNAGNCAPFFAPGAEVPAMPALWPMLVAMVGALIVMLLVHIKIFQILLGKRYRRFRVRVTGNA